MKTITLTSLFLALTSFAFGQSYKKMYQSQLEPQSELIACEANYTIEELANGTVIFKKYYPPNRQITKRITFKDLASKIKHGLYQEIWDDGTVVVQGRYEHNQKQGPWLMDAVDHGEYKDDQKEGLWKSYRPDSTVYKEEVYLDGKLHGTQVEFDSLGNIIIERVYQHGELLSTMVDSTSHVVEEMPRFPGCEDQGLSPEELKQCAQNELLKYIYKKLTYPRRAREENIQGEAKIQFVVDEDGDMIDIKALNGISKDIKKECMKLIDKMPKWRPGMKDGKPVKVRYTLPIMFKLKP